MTNQNPNSGVSPTVATTPSGPKPPKTQNPAQPDLAARVEIKPTFIGHLDYDYTVEHLAKEIKWLQDQNEQLTAQLADYHGEVEIYGGIVKQPDQPDELFFKGEDGIVHSVTLFSSTKARQLCR